MRDELSAAVSSASTARDDRGDNGDALVER
jgi:hypothetical protein